jgi:hypothetical protein
MNLEDQKFLDEVLLWLYKKHHHLHHQLHPDQDHLLHPLLFQQEFLDHHHRRHKHNMYLVLL